MDGIVPRPPKISIVTITLNRRALLEEAIASVLAQRYPDVEHIVIDGGSTDGTVELLKAHRHLRWISEKDEGQADAMNKGLALMTGDIFGWLNSDDAYTEGAFHTVARRFAADPALDMLYGTCRLINGNGEYIGRTRFHRFDLNRLKLGYNNVNTPAVFARAAALAKAGPMDVSLRATYDADMWIRIGMAGKVRAIPDRLTNLRLHADSGLVSTRYHVGEIKTLREKYGAAAPAFDRYVRRAYFALRHTAYDMFRFNRLLKRI